MHSHGVTYHACTYVVASTTIGTDVTSMVDIAIVRQHCPITVVVKSYGPVTLLRMRKT